MRSGARNELVGIVTDIVKGDLMCKVKVKIPAETTMCSVMTVESLENLGLKESDSVNVLAKAVNVLLVKE